MGRLAGVTAYVAGYMDAAEDGGEGWRNEVIPHLQKRGVLVINPCNKPMIGGSRDEKAGRADINQMKKEGRYAEIRPTFGEEIRGTDLHYVDVSTFLLVHLTPKISTVGSFEEIFWANRCKKPVLVWYEGGCELVPNWLYLCLPQETIFGSWDEVEDYLEYIDNAPEIDTLGRWKFIDWARVIRETEAVYGSFARKE